MRITYIGTPDDETTQEVTLFGLVFPKGEAVDVSDLSPECQSLLDGNPTFLTEAEGDLKADPDVEIPADWSEQHWKTRCVLASQISGKAQTKAVEADAIIDAEVERRANASAGSKPEPETPVVEPGPADEPPVEPETPAVVPVVEPKA